MSVRKYYRPYTSGLLRMNDMKNIVKQLSATSNNEWFHKIKKFGCSDAKLQINLSTAQPEEVRFKFGYGLIQYHLTFFPFNSSVLLNLNTRNQISFYNISPLNELPSLLILGLKNHSERVMRHSSINSMH